MANFDLGFDPATNGLGKPAKGSGYMQAKDRRANRRDAEQSVMRAAKVRDHHQCRWPGCNGKYRGLELPIDACHAIHRGPGGNPDGSRTAATSQLVSLCRRHHQMWDGHEIDLQPLTDAAFDGPVSFHEKRESGKFEHVASESRRGVSVAVGN